MVQTTPVPTQVMHSSTLRRLDAVVAIAVAHCFVSLASHDGSGDEIGLPRALFPAARQISYGRGLAAAAIGVVRPKKPRRARQQRENDAAIRNSPIGGIAQVVGGRHRRARRDGGRLRHAVDHCRRAQGHRRRGRWRTFHSGIRRCDGLARLRRRRHSHGAHCRAGRRALDRGRRRRDDRHRARSFDVRAALAAHHRSRPVHRRPRPRRHQCAVLRLCQPLVRPASRFGVGADFQRQLPCRRDLAVDLRAPDCICGMAAHDAVIRCGRAVR